MEDVVIFGRVFSSKICFPSIVFWVGGFMGGVDIVVVCDNLDGVDVTDAEGMDCVDLGRLPLQ